MLKKNNIWFGALIGLILPVLGIVIFSSWLKDAAFIGRPVLPYFVIIFFNLILIRVFHRNNAERTVRGIMLVTFAFVIYVFLIKLKV